MKDKASDVIFKGCTLGPKEFKAAVREHFASLARLAGEELVKEEAAKLIKKACKRRAKELNEHFHIHGWNVRPMDGQIIADEFGVDMVSEVLWNLDEATYAWREDPLMGGQDLYWTLPHKGKPHEFAIYDTTKNEIKVYDMDAKWPRDGGRYEWLGRV